jgi:hypothetical protein
MRDWRTLFDAPGDASAPVRRLKALQKGNRSFLYLPELPGPAETTLELYPAQKKIAKAYVAGMRTLIRCRLPLPGPLISLSVDGQAGFAKFLREIGGGGEVPLFGVLEGYLRNPYQRFVFLLFDAAAQPQMVAKAGLTPQAMELIRREHDFLVSAPVLPGVPRVRGFFQAGNACAVALPYEPGRPPAYEEWRNLGQVFEKWVNPESPIPMGKLAKWHGMAALAADRPRLAPLFERAARTLVRPTLSHGDFGPWNIRLSAQAGWRILDWERGCLDDFPGWDWYNFIVQYHLLVKHASPEQAVSALEELWRHPPFRAYAEATGIQDIVPETTVLQLLYMDRYFALEGESLFRVAEEIVRRHFPALHTPARS